MHLYFYFYCYSISVVYSMFTKMFNNITVYKALEYFNVWYSLMMVQWDRNSSEHNQVFCVLYRVNKGYYNISLYLNWNPDTMCTKCWNDQNHNNRRSQTVGRATRGRSLSSGGGTRVVCRRDIGTLKEIWAQVKYIFGQAFAWLKYFIKYLFFT
jgi:hypothetical protein